MNPVFDPLTRELDEAIGVPHVVVHQPLPQLKNVHCYYPT